MADTGVVSVIKTRPLKQESSLLSEEMAAEHQAVPFHSEARWLAPLRKSLLELREQRRRFLEQEHKSRVAEKCSD